MDLQKYFHEWKFKDDFIEQIETFAAWRGSSLNENAIRALDTSNVICSAQNVLIMTKNHEVYAVGGIIKSWSYKWCRKPKPPISEPMTDYYEPVKLSLLSGERIKKVVHTSDVVFICTEKGEAFGYGFRFFGSIPEGGPQKVRSLLGLNVVDITIGPYSVPYRQHFALCDDGKVMKITILDDPRFRHDNSISEQKDRCEIMIFQKDGDLIDHCKIEKLIGGYGHALALDEYGRLFQTGHYFLKKPSYIKYEHFELNSFITEKIVDIAACMTQHLSAALTESGKIYMWGKSRSEIIYPEPVLTAYKSLHEVFLYDAPDSLETYRPIHVDELSAVTSEPTTKPTTEPHIMPIESSMTDTLHSLTNSCETEFADPAETSKPINVDELSAVVTSEPTTELHIMPIESNMADTQHSLTNSFEKEFADPAETSKPINVDELSAIVTSEPHTMPIESSIPDTQHSLTDSFKKAFNDPVIRKLVFVGVAAGCAGYALAVWKMHA